MGKLTYLPAYDCVFYRSGRCVYEEFLNPGLDSERQCLVLAELENRFDHLMTQADNFDLSDRQVSRIWARRFGEAVSWERYCGDYQPKGVEDDRCQYLLGNACINRFSGCRGVCSLYVLKSPKIDIES